MVLSGQNTFILRKSLIVWETCLVKKEIPTSTIFFAKIDDRNKAQDRPNFNLILNFRVCENDIAMAIEAAKQYEDEVSGE